MRVQIVGIELSTIKIHITSGMDVQWLRDICKHIQATGNL